MRKYPWVKESKKELSKYQKRMLKNSYTFLKESSLGIALTLSEESYQKFEILRKAFVDFKQSIKNNDKNFYKI